MIGPYQLVEELGRGGQGVVYLAQDTRLPRRVALKLYADPRLLGLLPVCEHVIKRFRREAEAASKLQHPGICAVYEAGEHQGAPYLAMQYVQGTPLSELIDKAREADDGAPATELVSTRASRDGLLQIVRLVEDVARSLHVAHEAGLVHRDIKPANIMVQTDGHPVILDFGLVRDDDSKLQGLTLSNEVMGTPSYMPPEQLSSSTEPVDRRADVYSLGIVLYECVALQPPFVAPTVEELYRSILHDDPSSVRRVLPNVPRDLETILGVALEKNPDRRYRTAMDFAEDLNRLRHGDPPAVARRPGPWRRVSRWARRNPTVAAALAITLSFLIAGIAWTTHKNAQLEAKNVELDQTIGDLERSNTELARQEGEARDARAAADRERDKAERFTRFVAKAMALASPNRSAGREVTLIDAIDAIERGLASELENDPELRAAMYGFVGDLYRSVARYEEAGRCFERAESLLDELDGPTRFTADVWRTAGWHYYELGNPVRGAQLTRNALDAFEQADGPRPLEWAHSISNLSEMLLATGELDEAEKLQREALAWRRHHLPANHADTAVSLQILGDIARLREDLEGAANYYRDALAMRRALYGENNPEVAESLTKLSSLAFLREDYAEAERLSVEALDIQRRTLPEGSSAISTSLFNLAMVRLRRSRTEAALETFDEALAVLDSSSPSGHPRVVQLRAYQIDILQRHSAAEFRSGNVAAAEASARRVVELAENAAQPDVKAMIAGSWLVARCELERDALAAAERTLLRSYELASRLEAATDDQGLIRTLESLVELYDRTNNSDEKARFDTLLEQARNKQ